MTHVSGRMVRVAVLTRVRNLQRQSAWQLRRSVTTSAKLEGQLSAQRAADSTCRRPLAQSTFGGAALPTHRFLCAAEPCLRGTRFRRSLQSISANTSVRMSNNDPNVKQSWRSSVNDKGEFVRKASAFRDWISADGSTGFKAEAGRYHLYVSLACPWAHRALIVRKLKGLDDVIDVTVVDWLLGEGGWNFTDSKPKCTLDTVNNCKYLKEVYLKANPDYAGNITVPCLWDKQKKTVVNNESSEIIRMFNSEFNAFCKTEEQRKLDLYPQALRDKIDAVNEWVYPQINNGVYRCGFARSQEAYNKAVEELFEGLDKVEAILSKSRYLVGNQLTEADVRLFTTLVRFDSVYHTHFKTNKCRIVDYPSMWGFVRDVYQLGGVAETVDQEHIMHHYFESHKSINPFSIVPVGPQLNFLEPSGRDNM